MYYQVQTLSVNSTLKVTLKFFWKEAQIDRIASESDKSSWNVLLAKTLPNFTQVQDVLPHEVHLHRIPLSRPNTRAPTEDRWGTRMPCDAVKQDHCIILALQT